MQAFLSSDQAIAIIIADMAYIHGVILDRQDISPIQHTL